MTAKSERAEQVMIIGLDAPIVPRLRRLAKQGKLPHFQALIEQGVIANNCMVPYPTITPPNWTTIVTGAWAGTHGITCFHVHKPGDPLDKIHPGFSSDDSQAEYIWQAIARAGKRAILVNYPSTWPATLGDMGVQVGGAGLAINEWRIHDQSDEPWDTRNDVSESQLFATEEYPLAQVVEPQPASEWQNAPDEAKWEVELPCVGRSTLSPLQTQIWYGLILADEQGRCDRLLIASEKDAQAAFCILAVGEWSEKIVREFQTAKGTRKAAFRFKLLELSADGQELKLFVSPLCALDGFTYPPELAQELADLDQMPWCNYGLDEQGMEWIDDETWEEIMRWSHEYFSQAADRLLSQHQWHLYCTHLHCPDWFYHRWATDLDPQTTRDPDLPARCEQLELAMYKVIDDHLAALLNHADENTLVLIVSDHGAQPTTGDVPIHDILEAAGLTVFAEGQDPESRQVDWSRTKAFAQRSCYIYVNLKGRDPQGIVEPGAEYEQIQEEIIKALYDYTDPDTGKKPFSFVLRREDARVLGLHGDMIGDVVFAFTEDFCGQHGPILPTAGFGIGSIEGLLIMKGPGVKQGEELQRTCWLTDIVPTVCHLAQWPVPAQAEGGILYQALENPNAQLQELQRCRKNYERLTRVTEATRQETHSYHNV